MTIRVSSSLLHWNYFLALEDNLFETSRYVDFSKRNFKTHSIEFAQLLLASSSEVDVIAKGICRYLDPELKPGNIDDYRAIIRTHIPRIHREQVFVPRFGLKFRPWLNWGKEENPSWWKSHNKVKHQRTAYFRDANLQNTLNSMGGLIIFIFHYYRLDMDLKDDIYNARDVTRTFKPKSRMLKLRDEYYYSNLIV